MTAKLRSREPIPCGLKLRRPSICAMCLLLALSCAFSFSVAAQKELRGVAPASWQNDLTPIQTPDWNYDRAAHLLERAGFGGTPEEIQALTSMTPQDAVRHLVYYQNVKDAALYPFVETGVYPSKNWSRDRMVAAFSAILFGALDKLSPDERRKIMDDERTGVTPEDKRSALTDKQAVVDKFYYWRNLHDEGEKTVLGRTGKFKGEEVVDILLEQPACARFIARKLYRFFVREDLSKELEEQLTSRLRGNKYDIAPFLEQVFLSRDFYSPASYATQIKSPAHLVISTYKKLGLKDAPTYPKFSAITGGLGQEIFYPPNVKGWDGGRTWINPATIFQRQNVARYILFPEEAPIVKDAHLAGSRRLSGDFIHNQFLEMAERGDYTGFPKGDSGKMANGAMDGGAAPGGAMTETSKLSGEDFNLFRGVFNAAVRAVAAVPAEPRRTADFNLSKTLQNSGATDAPGAVDYLMRRFLRAPITGERRQTLIRFLERQMGGSQIDFSRYRLEKDLREVLHLIICAPEYQLL